MTRFPVPGLVRVARAIALTALLVMACARPASPQGAAASALKAAFLFNFAKFVQWPAEALPAGAPLVLCVVGDSAVAAGLEETIKGRSIEGHDLSVRRMNVDGSLRACHLVYASGLDVRHAVELIDHLKGAPVLTASDLDRFAQCGGVTHLFIEGGKMRFAVNVDSAQRAGLRVSSKLLGLAVLVKDERYALPQ